MGTLSRAYVVVSILSFVTALFLGRWDNSVRSDPERARSPDRHRWVDRGLICACVNMFLAAVVLVIQTGA